LFLSNGPNGFVKLSNAETPNTVTTRRTITFDGTGISSIYIPAVKINWTPFGACWTRLTLCTTPLVDNGFLTQPGVETEVNKCRGKHRFFDRRQFIRTTVAMPLRPARLPVTCENRQKQRGRRRRRRRNRSRGLVTLLFGVGRFVVVTRARPRFSGNTPYESSTTTCAGESAYVRRATVL